MTACGVFECTILKPNESGHSVGSKTSNGQCNQHMLHILQRPHMICLPVVMLLSFQLLQYHFFKSAQCNVTILLTMNHNFSIHFFFLEIFILALIQSQVFNTTIISTFCSFYLMVEGACQNAHFHLGYLSFVYQQSIYI